ncbi:Lrp/AsnC family transcriptional regulator [Marinilactibacillus piezotolerans]|uniref:Lrp/AsnC family transcriptional regulator n=1 Tax=Marinilactibacillus piezotolerans TaxID=258723 RepID=UPI0009B1A7A8|nr:Lrp/AsnC family transcriptional regulator [Marinilactibacillus piezotolerans]
MDQMDKKIVEILQKNSRASLKEIAGETYLSSPAVSARIHRLENEGILGRYIAAPDLKKMGYHIQAFIHLDLSPNQKEDFYPYIEHCTNVLECNCVTGEFSMLIKVAYPTTTELDDFINNLQQFGKTSTQIVFSTPVPARGVQLIASEEEENQ